MIFGSVCSGIEAASVAWHPIGFRARWFAEIAPFPSAVLAARWPDVRNLGDFTTIGAEHGPVDILVGGTPCQSFSVAGGRAGLDDPRGVLALEFVRLARRVGARWIVWENVPGALSSGGGQDIRDVVGAFVDAGYSVAWRVLDAQWFGVPQRRRRFFAVGYLGDWRPPFAVLFESPRMRRDPQSSRGSRSPSASGAHGVADRVVSNALTTRATRNDAEDTYALVPIPIQDATRGRRGIQNGIGIGSPGDVSFTLATRSTHAIAFHTTQDPISGPISMALSCEPGHVGVVDRVSTGEITGSLTACGWKSRDSSGVANNLITSPTRPRRLTPREWERLQGFPDDYTAITYKRKPALDGPRYAAIGNSMAVPVMRWIGDRILFVDDLVCWGAP